MQHITNKFAHNINEIRYKSNKNAHVVDGYGHGENIFNCNIREYRHFT